MNIPRISNDEVKIKHKNEQSLLIKEIEEKTMYYQYFINIILEELLDVSEDNKRPKKEYEFIINELYTNLYNELRENEIKILEYHNNINELYASLSKTKTKTKKYCPMETNVF